MHLDGSFRGEIISRGTLVVGSESVVHAQIHSTVLKVSGEVHGDLTATEKIELYPPAKVYGNIRTPSLVVEEGVIFEGTCRMSSIEAERTALAESVEVSSDDEEALDAISAEAWSSEYSEDEELGGRSPEDGPFHKHGQ